MEIILAGQPNCGKSTILNSVIGYRSISSNFPGASVQYTKGEMLLLNERVTVVDLPGTYSLLPRDPAEKAAWKYLLHASRDSVIINVVDASVLSRSLELTLQLMELRRPMVLALNMIDEAERKSLKFNVVKLSRILGIPVVLTNARNGKGIYELFKTAYQTGQKEILPRVIRGNAVFEKRLEKIRGWVSPVAAETGVDDRFMALKVWEGDVEVTRRLRQHLSTAAYSRLTRQMREMEGPGNNGGEQVVSSFRHHLSFDIFEAVTRVGKATEKDWRRWLDRWLMHPVLGYVFLVMILALSFGIVALFASAAEPALNMLFELAREQVQSILSIRGAGLAVFTGFWEGFAGGIGIAVAYLLPFFMILAFLEDLGYLARISYLIDNIMHKIGLHGLSVIPMILGFGCTVPAILGTRIIKSEKDRLVTAVLTTLIPCSARMVVILGLIGALFSIQAALLVYVVDLLIIGITGRIMSRTMKKMTPGLVLEIPRYHLPVLRILVKKTWFRMKEFIVIAWPLLMVGSIIMQLITHFHLDHLINALLRPFTAGILGLPAALGVVILFGLLRKELALILFTSALGLASVSQTLTVIEPYQVYIFVIFITFYMPCLATIAALIREFNLKKAILITALTFGIAVTLALLVRLAALVT